jgi:hypothetical protein
MKSKIIAFGYDCVQIRGGRWMIWWEAFSSHYEFMAAKERQKISR